MRPTIDRLNKAKSEMFNQPGAWSAMMHQRKKQSNNNSGHQNIFWVKKRSKWGVAIVVNGKRYYGGYYDNIDDAIVARDELKNKYVQPLIDKFPKLNKEIIENKRKQYQRDYYNNHIEHKREYHKEYMRKYRKDHKNTIGDLLKNK